MNYFKKKLIKIILFIALPFLFLSCSDNTGTKLPDFTATTLTGKVIHSKDLKGKVIVLKIWATWCGSCVVEIPQLNSLVEKYKNDSTIVFLAITDDSKTKIEKFLLDRPFAYQHIVDAKVLKNIFQPGLSKEIPQHIVVDKALNIVFDVSGESSTIAEQLSAKIEQLK